MSDNVEFAGFGSSTGSGGAAAASFSQEMTARGFIAWTGNPNYAQTSNAPASQTEVAAKIMLPTNLSITGCAVMVITAGSTLTSGQNLVTLYNQAGTKQASTADQSAIWTTAAAYTAAFAGGPFALTGGAGAYCWVSILSNGTTPATFRSHHANQQVAAVGGPSLLSGAGLMDGRIGAAVTAPATFTPSSLVSTNAYRAFIGLY